ncbi:MAG: 3-methyl-2-oxobutanoate hydroxymethyltransferase [Metallibacterium sp.]
MYVEAAAPARKAVTIPMLRAMKARGEKIAMLTCYDASFATLIETAGVDVALVGDSLGMVVQGRNSTLPVTLDDMAYHTRLVARGLSATLLVTDLPYMSYRDTAHAREAAARLLGECGAAMLKLEGASWVCEIIADLVAREAPVCAHLGLTPQAVHRLGGYKVQGREQDAAERLFNDAQAVQAAGAELLVLEAVPAPLATRITQALQIPVIGIGAGVDCDGQVLVLYDMLGITPGKRPRFSKDFLGDAGSVANAIKAYVAAVRGREFPGAEHVY